MNSNKKLFAAIMSALFLSACASTQTSDTATANTSKTEMEAKQVMASDLDARTQALNEREAQLASAQAELDAQRSNTSAMSASTAGSGQLLPPKAKAGECYARVWVKPTYRTNSETILVSEASEKFATTPAQYETVTEEVLVKEASFYMEPIPAVYGTETETLLVSEGQMFWSVDLQKNAAPASDELLAAAKNHGIDLDLALVTMSITSLHNTKLFQSKY